MGDADTGHDGDREQLVSEALGEYLDRVSRGDAEPEEEFLAEHAELAGELGEYLELIQHLKRDHSTIQGLIAQGVLEPRDDADYPAKLGPYQVTRFVGRGGMGVVLEAYEEALDRKVALKILRPDLADDATAVARFTREAKAAAALQHPNIVTVYAVGQHRQAHYLAMEFVEGPTLAEVIRERGPLPTETIRTVFRQLLEGLSAAHQAGLIHRDIKSSNILLDADPISTASVSERPTNDTATPRGSESKPSQSPIPNRQSPVVKIADFGLARMLSAQTRLTLETATPGTPEYMSPEQARGDADLDHRTDLYSAGVVLYEMLTGRTPFKADAPSAVIHRILHEAPPDPRKLAPTADSHLASLALRLMAKQPEDRFPSATDALEALEAAERVRSLERRRRGRRRLVAAVLAAALVCGGAWLMARLGERPSHAVLPHEAAAWIADVWVDATRPTTVLARFGDDAAETIVHVFDPEAVNVLDVVKLDPDGRGKTVVVAGVQHPINGMSVFAFDVGCEPMWSLPLLSEDIRWPDCSESKYMRCTHLVAEDFDGEPGDELIVVGTHLLEYPTRVSLLDPRTKKFRSTFWHMGCLTGILPIRNFFSEGRPAIIAWGNNNALDGFKDGLQGDEVQFSHWDIVQAVMVLDPLNMDGLGPPPTRRVVGLTPAPICAYAFLDMPPDLRKSRVTHADGHERLAVSQELHPLDAGFIAGLKEEPRGMDQRTSPWFWISVRHRNRTEETVGGVHLTVDRNLNLLTIIPSGGVGDETGHPPEFWRQIWHPIIQNGEYATEAIRKAE